MFDFFVPFPPQPGGSKRPITHPRTGKTVLVDDAKHNREWRDAVILFANQAKPSGFVPFAGPVQLTVNFYLQRPRGHFDRLGQLKSDAPEYHLTRPDATKLLRSTEDALTEARVWRDDSQVVMQQVIKAYANQLQPEGAHIQILDLNT